MVLNEAWITRLWEFVENTYLLLRCALDHPAENCIAEATAILALMHRHVRALRIAMDADPYLREMFRNQRTTRSSPSDREDGPPANATGVGDVPRWIEVVRRKEKKPCLHAAARKNGSASTSSTRTSHTGPTAPGQVGNSGHNITRAHSTAPTVGDPYTAVYRPVGLYPAYPTVGYYQPLQFSSMPYNMCSVTYGPLVEVEQQISSFRPQSQMQTRAIAPPAPVVPHVAAPSSMQQRTVPIFADYPIVQEPSLPMQQRVALAAADPSHDGKHYLSKRKRSASAVADPQNVGEQRMPKQQRETYSCAGPADAGQQGMPKEQHSEPASADAEPVCADLPGTEEQVIPMEQSAASTVDDPLNVGGQEMPNQQRPISAVAEQKEVSESQKQERDPQ